MKKFFAEEVVWPLSCLLICMARQQARAVGAFGNVLHRSGARSRPPRRDRCPSVTTFMQ